MEDRYIKYTQCFDRLLIEYKKYNSLLIAFDFDNTVFDCLQVDDTFPMMEELLKRSKQIGCKLILFTVNENEALDKAIQYCQDRGYAPDYVNESPIMNTRKPFYNLLLDDRAGLGEATKLLSDLLETIK